MPIDCKAEVQTLAHLPSRCPMHVPMRPLKYEYRKLGVGNYLVLFRVSEKEEVVTVARVLYGRSRLDSHLE